MISTRVFLGFLLLAGCTTTQRLRDVNSAHKPTNPLCWEDPLFKKISLKPGQPDAISIYYYEEDQQIANEIASFALALDAELQEFFEIGRSSEYRIYIASSHEHYEQLENSRVDWIKDWWLVGSNLSSSDQVIISPRIWDPRSREFVFLRELVKHEMAHSFAYALRGIESSQECRLNQMSNTEVTLRNPYWIEEGIAVAASGQVITWKDKILNSVKNYPSFETVLEPEFSYPRAGAAAQFLIDQYGKKTFLEAIRVVTLECRKNRDSCNQTFLRRFDNNPHHIEPLWKDYVRKTWR